MRGRKAFTTSAGDFPTIENYVGATPLVRLQRLPGNTTNTILAKLEGNNPAGSVKDRPALNMINEAERRGDLTPGDTLIEATSGNTGIALAMAAAIKGYKMKLIMPSNMSEERRASMAAYGAELISVPPGAMEIARDMAQEMAADGQGVVLDQFGNLDNPAAHFEGTGPEIWSQTGGQVTHFISSMGTTGTIMGNSRYLKGQNPEIEIIGLQPSEGASIPGIRRWPKEYLPRIFDEKRVDRVMNIGQLEAEETMRAMARTEGIFAGVSSGGAIAGALRLSEEVENATIVAIVCDRGDRYLSTGVFSAKESPAPTDPEGFWMAVTRLMGLPNLYVLFTSDLDPESGRAWCPDCARAEPAVERALEEHPDATLLVCRVGPRPAWKDPQHPLRVDPNLQVSCIPTLVQWGIDTPMQNRCLGDKLEECGSEDEVYRLVTDFM
ncbi:hypothetical protein CYMTET_13193 [Cymbomonas tetramitiformis]|uniref:Cysteine synthase n=1 Tax=Cymbomonas tetramitiformis TaxID=36881 RepID=A0AAE0LBQ2_9CHLO|nr:hypothetical protein CYMTET_13193 [Cymbomonas tetramitiformis]